MMNLHTVDTSVEGNQHCLWFVRFIYTMQNIAKRGELCVHCYNMTKVSKSEVSVCTRPKTQALN